MRQEQRVVNRIKHFLQSNVQMDLPELAALAEEYATLCRKTNERLGRCEHYMRSGMRTAAIHLAEASPPILDVAAALDFHGVEAWREFTRQTEQLEVPLPIAAQTVSWLNRAYVQEGSLADLLSEYRSLAHRGTLAQKVSVLRRLAELDKENAGHWLEDLKEFERARQRELKTELRAAAEADDLQAMEALHAELASQDWTVAPDERLQAELDAHIQRVREKKAQAAGQRIAREGWDAYGALDHARAGLALARWESLLAEGYFRPPADLAENIREVQEWFEIERQRLAEENEFRQAVEALPEILDRGAGRAELERLLFAATRHGRAIPPELRRRVERAIEDARLAEARKRRLVIAGIVVALLAVAIPAFLFVRSVITERRRKEWAERIDQARERRDFETSAKLLAELQERYPRIAAAPAFQEREEMIRLGADQYEKERMRCDEMLGQLAQLQEQGFPPDRPYAEMDRMADSLVHTPEERGRLEDWRLAWKTHEVQVQRARDERFTVQMDSALVSFDELASLNPEEEDEPYGVALDGIQDHLSAAKAMTGVSEALTARLSVLEQRLYAHRAILREARERVALRKRLLERIPRALPNLEGYEALLKEFVTEFPEDPATPRFRRALADCAVGRDLERGATWSLTYDAEAAKKIKAFLQSPESEGSMWRDSLEWMQWQIAMAPRLPEVVQSIRRLRSNPRYYDLRSFEYTDRTTDRTLRYYYVDDPQRGASVGAEGRQTVEYIINVFEGENEPIEKRFTMPPIATRLPEALAPHCKWFRRIHRNLLSAEPPDAEIVLLRGLGELRIDAAIDPIVKVVFLKAFLAEAKKLSPNNVTQIDQMLAKLETINTNVLWTNPRPDRATEDARQEVRDSLAEMADLSTLAFRTSVINRLHRASLARKPRCVGQVVSAGDGFRMDLGRLRRPEVWIAVSRPEVGPAVYVAALADEDGVLQVQPEASDSLYAGQPVFAPSDGKLTRELLRDIIEDIPPSELAPVEQGLWPASWPVNGRNVELASRERRDGNGALLRALARLDHGPIRP